MDFGGQHCIQTIGCFAVSFAQQNQYYYKYLPFSHIPNGILLTEQSLLMVTQSPHTYIHSQIIIKVHWFEWYVARVSVAFVQPKSSHELQDAGAYPGFL